MPRITILTLSLLTISAWAQSKPDLSGLRSDERYSMESVCSTAKVVTGPAAYNRCVADQLTTFRTSAPSADRQPQPSAGISFSQVQAADTELAYKRLLYFAGIWNING